MIAMTTRSSIRVKPRSRDFMRATSAKKNYGGRAPMAGPGREPNASIAGPQVEAKMVHSSHEDLRDQLGTGIVGSRGAVRPSAVASDRSVLWSGEPEFPSWHRSARGINPVLARPGARSQNSPAGSSSRRPYQTLASPARTESSHSRAADRRISRFPRSLADSGRRSRRSRRHTRRTRGLRSLVNPETATICVGFSTAGEA